MIKILSVVIFLSSAILAQNFDEFLNNALQNSPYLKTQDLSKEQTSLQGEVLTRYENPSIELEYSNFKPSIGSSKDGYRVALSQPIRLWGVADDKESFTQASKIRADARYKLSHASLQKEISLLFTRYAQIKELYLLADEELHIAKRIYEISQERYSGGTISQGVMLQAKVDFEMSEIALDTLELHVSDSYFKLLEVAGETQEVELKHQFTFTLQNSTQASSNPDLQLTKAMKVESMAQVEVNRHALEWVNLAGEYENEPDQDIFRVGVSIPIALFNTKEEEKRIASLDVKKAELISKKQSDTITLELLKLKQQRALFQELISKNGRTLATQEKLLEMFEESYKIASVNLLELQNIKNGVITTKASLIKLNSQLDKNTININYMQGAYNE